MGEANRSRRAARTVVPLGTRSFAAKYLGNFPRLREWSLGEIATVSDHPFSIRECGSNSNWNKRSTFRRGVLVQSYATCTLRVCVLTLAGTRHEIRAPRGYKWDIDENGLRLRSCSHPQHDYHPSATELLTPVAEIVARLKANVLARREAARLAKQQAREEKQSAKQRADAIKRAEREGIAVCLRDSVRAGNCESGSSQWAQRHGLDPARHYSPSAVLALANGDTSRVALVVTVALARHRREMQAGVCVLADHR
jgi:hypothetical protein